MPPAYISTEHIDYLQRAREKDQPGSLSTVNLLPVAPPDQRYLWHITRIGQLDKGMGKKQAPLEESQPRLPTEDMLIGLYGARVPVSFLVYGSPEEVAVHLGTWSLMGPETVATNVDILLSGLHSLYPSVTVSPDHPELIGLHEFGLALGIPTTKSPDPVDGAVALDRLVRAMLGARWACLVLAQPEEEQAITRVRLGVVDELREAHAALRRFEDEQVIKHYTELLTASLTTLTTGLALGMWRTTVYLFGDSNSYPRLASLWRGIFSGRESLPEPVRVWARQGVARMVTEWATPDAPGRDGPGRYRHPFEYQTLLTSKQLSAYIHLPQIETAGFAVQAVPDFDAVPPRAAGEAVIHLGEIALRSRPTRSSYAVPRRDLTRHAFVAGVTGAGKTNTTFHLLTQLNLDQTRFLVIEPAKQEYRALLSLPELANRLHVFTLAEERVAPFRLNPFEVVGWPRTSVGVHLDLLRSVFAASFGMWTPLPQVLEQCLHRIYEDRGWDITANTNHRLGEVIDPTAAFPTLSELAAKVEEVTRELGYEERITSDMRAALLTRINSLRTGGKGRMLDVQRSLPMTVLLEHPTVLELEGIGDDDDKAFVMGLIFVRLVEYRRAEGPSKDLLHLLVIEEAHRLLTNVGERREEEGNPRGKAVETFANLLSEIRAYGQGVLIADQVPVKLAPDVIKNTNLKIAHRVVAADDRAALAGAMAMSERQAHVLATLERGQAAVFSEGDDAPLVVLVPLVKGAGEAPVPTDEQVARRAVELPALVPYRALFQPLQKAVGFALEDERAWEAARHIVGTTAFQRSFARLALSVIEAAEALDRLWPDLLAQVRARRSQAVDEESLLRCVAVVAAEWLALRRGAQAGWSYSETQGLADRLQALLIAKVSAAAVVDECTAFREYALQLHFRRFDPFPACSRICRQQPPQCLYRFAARDLIADEALAQAWDLEFQPVNRQTWERCMDAGYALIEFASEEWPGEKIEAADAAARRASLCFGQQMLTQQLMKSPHEARFWVGKLIAEAHHE